MTAILGISAFYHDSAAALVVDGEIVAAAQEERFTRVKHDHVLPRRAMEYCLKEAGLTPGDLDLVGFYDKPFLKFDRLLETYLAVAPAGFRSFLQAMPLWLRQKLHLPREMRRGLAEIADEDGAQNGGYRKRFVFTEHHEAHAASAFFPSPFEEAAVLTLDGVGEWATAAYGTGRGNRLDLTHELRFPHSLGLLYSAFTYYCGFRVNSGEYKLMGLAPYGEPRYAEAILEHLVDLRDDGSFHLDQSYFNYCQGLTMTSAKLHRLFGGSPRQPESPLGQREMDLAASIQQVTEEIVLRVVRHVHRQTGLRDLCLAGGVALNCVANGRILREGPFDRLWVQPAAGDAGGALGVALFTWYQLLDQPRRPQPGGPAREGSSQESSPQDSQHGSLLGPAFGDDAIRAFLDSAGVRYRSLPDQDELCRHAAELLADGQVLGWFQGRMEFGPRALGNRSILGDARRPEMQSVMNRKIKFRESFRPFAPVVLAERAAEFFGLEPGQDSPYMLVVAPVREEKRRAEAPGAEPSPTAAELPAGFDRLRQVRSEIPAVTHVDGSARVQTVDRQRNPRFHQLLRAFEERTGCPVLINTSFNVRGEPIVATPEDAFRCFMATDMDVLVLGRHVLHKQEQPAATAVDRQDHLSQFALD